MAVDMASIRIVKAITIDLQDSKPIVIYVHVSSMKSVQKLGKKLIN